MTGFLKDFFTGDFATAWKDVTEAFKKLPQVEQDFITKLESDSWALIRSLADVAFKDVVAGGFTTASFVAAGKDVVAQAAAQGQTVAISDAVIQLNILKSAMDANAPVVETPAM